MLSRRVFLAIGAASVSSLAVMADDSKANRSPKAKERTKMSDKSDSELVPVPKSDAEWKKILTPQQYFHAAEGHGTSVHRRVLEHEKEGCLSLCLLQTVALQFGRKIRFWNGLAELLAADR